MEALLGNGTGTKLRVVCPVTGKDGKTHWLKMGAAFPNKDRSINIYLDGFPMNGKLQIREWDDPPWERRGGSAGTGAVADPTPHLSRPDDLPPF
jgi:hypothetical protein